MAIESTQLSTIHTVGVPATRKDVARVTQTLPDKSNTKPVTELQVVRPGSEPVFQQADSFRQTAGVQGAGSFKGQIAIDAYESIAKEQQRQNIQQLLGVDTYI